MIKRTNKRRKINFAKKETAEKMKWTIAAMIFHRNQKGNQMGKRRIFKKIMRRILGSYFSTQGPIPS